MNRRTLLLAAIGAALPWPRLAAPLASAGSAGAQTAADGDGIGGADVVEMAVGDPDAPVEVIEYASFTCPHCRRFHETVYPQLKETYIDPGLVRFVHREVYFDRYALWAAMVARCAGPDRYFGVVDMIYERQADWTQGAPAEIAENLRRIGRMAGMTNDRLDACLTDSGKARALLDADEANRQAHEVPGTPSFVIGGKVYSNMSYSEFAAILDERLAAAR